MNDDAKTPRLGFWLMSSSLTACEMAALVGFDVAVLDMEHGVHNPREADGFIVFCKARGFVVYSRVASAERVPIQAALDAGADGVILPQILDSAHAAEAAAFAKYPPLGTRGMGLSRIQDYGPAGADFEGEHNRATRCYAMIETPGALDDAERIAALPTVDGLFIGSSDLSLTRGRGQYGGTADDEQDARKVAEAAAGAGKRWGMPASDARQWGLAVALNADFVTVADDLSALAAGFAQLHGAAVEARTAAQSS